MFSCSDVYIWTGTKHFVYHFHNIRGNQTVRVGLLVSELVVGVVVSILKGEGNNIDWHWKRDYHKIHFDFPAQCYDEFFAGNINKHILEK